ncbi:beta-D-xylosidase [Streptomyces sparsogenes DSM 40356]|uniref:Beta-D-xylosidase n=1 Tax=Streptomyces sparsogenes DSM 40356 TaxID=1331668 RepID=A0A1R1SS55_9ACTN|nr:beta-D-xylosidase [Streptomyces sparsogenes DSM 40356]
MNGAVPASRSGCHPFRLHADRLACTGPDLHRIVEPGEIRF